jgi:hypothetical protein
MDRALYIAMSGAIWRICKPLVSNLIWSGFVIGL